MESLRHEMLKMARYEAYSTPAMETVSMMVVGSVVLFAAYMVLVEHTLTSSQFYVVIDKPAPFLDEKEPDGMNKYTIFGQVVAGQGVAEKIIVGDKILKIKIVE